MCIRFTDRRGVALVTGGAKRIGRQISKRLYLEGYAVAIHSHRSYGEACALAHEIAGSRGDAVALRADLACPASIATLVNRAEQALGPVTLLVNNASEFENDSADDLCRRQWNRHFDVNLAAPAFLMSDMAQRLPPAATGAIVNIIDQRVWKLTPQFISYTLSKSALWTATRTFAQALAPRIRVNAVGPGPTLGNARQSFEDFEMQRSACLLGNGSSADDVAEAVAFLAAAKSITGQMIAVDGGQHLAWRTPDVDGIAE
ncbi:SDR family oxidoreductase [Methylobacterium nodulans]|uniref:Short-chain dehydrogenase/reductase SDR n=1 Tax=Methylobacterium nodulans (strain LMG 21967 / CNCM I-2342 / ORS 2060) TaxID=460265 RepID=B8IWN7_METNO|nr:SDR family oxidoreductase [Methylobacterium nodulans]ACL62928.1 short-chain dehydrogenase/reductase SDR [Methylobacterium nodulans ORS 2060]